MQHQPEGYREEVMVGQRVGYGRYQPGPKENQLPTGNQQPHCGRNMFGLSSRLLLCFGRLTTEKVLRPHTEIKITVLTISR